MGHPFPPNLQNIKNPKLLELESWNFEKMLPPTMCHMSHVTCHVSHVRCQVSGVRCHVWSVFSFSFFGQIAGASCWRVCHQRGLPRLVFNDPPFNFCYSPPLSPDFLFIFLHYFVAPDSVYWIFIFLSFFIFIPATFFSLVFLHLVIISCFKKK